MRFVGGVMPEIQILVQLLLVGVMIAIFHVYFTMTTMMRQIKECEIFLGETMREFGKADVMLRSG